MARRPKQREWQIANRAKEQGYQRAWRARVKYNLTIDEYDAIIAKGCAICGTNEGTICVDHSHETGQIREALCVNCNLGIGRFKDDPALTERAARYLRKHHG